ncbi:unnamed protein product [Didymodactylos carnosus]|uniref:Uncharacterized protein n=1 Tax=Didymodactylos carnosus TaxID=1234261 RepID=A0A8S2CYY9_9BILA|nr:unnamed protein product [Didymodactylos carnosus]CAF3555973.1 unnamed protein product [Didymodactylos carnosus]
MIIWTLYERRLLFRTFINLHYIRGNNELILQPWTPRWKEEFLNEKLRLNNIILPKWQHIFDKELSSDGIVHIGSTSITNIGLAKPVHDTAIAITTKYLPDNLRDDLEKAGYKYVGVAPHSLSCQDHWFFCITPISEISSKGYGFDLHVLLPMAHQWLRETVNFCQYLTENQIDRDRYSSLKREIAETETEIIPYAIKKQKLLPILIQKAQQWAKVK